MDSYKEKASRDKTQTRAPALIPTPSASVI
jgi:hypothetical protein